MGVYLSLTKASFEVNMASLSLLGHAHPLTFGVEFE